MYCLPRTKELKTRYISTTQNVIMLNKNFMVMKQQSGISTTYVLEFQSN